MGNFLTFPRNNSKISFIDFMGENLGWSLFKVLSLLETRGEELVKFPSRFSWTAIFTLLNAFSETWTLLLWRTKIPPKCFLNSYFPAWAFVFISIFIGYLHLPKNLKRTQKNISFELTNPFLQVKDNVFHLTENNFKIEKISFN